MRYLLFAIALGCLTRVPRAGGQTAAPADLVLHGGKIVTLDDRNSIASAIAIRGDRIIDLGDESLVARYRAARVIDLRGRMAMPGFNDSHIGES